MFSILESSYAHHYTIKAMFSVSNYFKLFSKKVGFCLQFLSSWPTFVIACLSMCYFAILFIRLKLFPKNKKRNMKENMGKGKAPIGLRAKNTKAIYHKSCKKYIFLNPSSIWCKYSCNISELWLLFPLIILRNHPKEFLSNYSCFSGWGMTNQASPTPETFLNPSDSSDGTKTSLPTRGTIQDFYQLICL